MTNKLISVLIGILIGFVINTKTCNNSYINKNFEHINDSLDKIVDSLDNIIIQENQTIAKLNKKDSLLVLKVENLTEQRNKAREEAHKKANNPNLSNSDTLHKFFVERYPTEDKTPFSLPKELLVDAARDLIYCDGTQKELKIADSTIFILNERIFVKDTTINSYKIKDTTYQAIIKTKDSKYNNLDNEYKTVKQTNNKLKKYIAYTSIWATIMTALYILK